MIQRIVFETQSRVNHYEPLKTPVLSLDNFIIIRRHFQLAPMVGGISDRERSLLNHLRDSIEILSADPEALEYESLAGNSAL